MQDTNNVKHLRVHFLCKGASNRISYYIKSPTGQDRTVAER